MYYFRSKGRDRELFLKRLKRLFPRYNAAPSEHVFNGHNLPNLNKPGINTLTLEPQRREGREENIVLKTLFCFLTSFAIFASR